MPSFQQRRQQAREISRVLIARAHIADRQVSDILYQSPYNLTNTGRPVLVPVAVVQPSRASRIFPLPPNKLLSRRPKML
jgi:hypothetical protein